MIVRVGYATDYLVLVHSSVSFSLSFFFFLFFALAVLWMEILFPCFGSHLGFFLCDVNGGLISPR